MDDPEPFDFDLADPDWDRVDPELRELDGGRVHVVTADGKQLSGACVVFPDLIADAARKREDDDAA